jgi:hypothetical protein
MYRVYMCNILSPPFSTTYPSVSIDMVQSKKVACRLAELVAHMHACYIHAYIHTYIYIHVHPCVRMKWEVVRAYACVRQPDRVLETTAFDCELVAPGLQTRQRQLLPEDGGCSMTKIDFEATSSHSKPFWSARIHWMLSGAHTHTSANSQIS